MNIRALLVISLVMVHWNQAKRLWDKDDLNLGYDFETSTDLNHAETGRANIRLDNILYKHGKYSLKWKWNVNQPLTLDLLPQLDQFKTNRGICGLHFWIHQKQPINTFLRVTYLNRYGNAFSFRLNLEFVNWRGVSRTFLVSKTRSFTGITKVSFQIEGYNPYTTSGELNLDLVRLASRCVGWAYDFVNTPQIPLPYGKRNEIGGVEDLNGVYDADSFWQNMYKWRKVDIKYIQEIDGDSPLTKEENRLTKFLNRIADRVDNWHFPNDQSYASLDELARAKFDDLQHCRSKQRDKTISKGLKKWINDERYGNFAHLRKTAFAWKDFEHDVCFRSAYQKFSQLSDPKTKKWPSLFPSRDVLPHGHENMTGLKFSGINHRILFPLSLEYFISRRKTQRKQMLKQGTKSPDGLIKVLKMELENEPFLLNNKHKNIYKTFRAVDHRRFKRFLQLYRHLISEGWDDGSGLGNTDHLLNLNAGFTHSIYLLRKELKNTKLFRRLLDTARWYNEIGELHQQNFPHKGTTADKIRVSMLGKLYTILASPHSTIKDARKKVNDAKNLKRWVENALEINEAYGGLIKPDYVGYHHKGVYMSAYIPFSLHALSLVAFFLHNTPFAISDRHLENLRNALKTLHVISNSHAVPVGVSGAKVSYTNAKINEIAPAFAYLALATSTNRFTVDREMASIFLKLYQKDNPFVKEHLVKGTVEKASLYLNSIGSIRLFEKVCKIARKTGVKPALTPSGNWAKPFAGLSIHRRKEWTVSIKGFSKYIWDYESTVDQNVYGRYFSHGQMQISNGRESLGTQDIFHGWDWNRIPGTTTVELSLKELKSQGKCRYFSNRTTVGGLTYGRKKTKNGIFVMDFKQPFYHDSFYQTHQHAFSFKKSFFLVDNMVICLGSNIQKAGLQNKRVITTLFQNKLKPQAEVRMDGLTFKKTNRINITIKNKDPITFLDANNNGYFIPVSNTNSVNFKIRKDINSEMPNGLKVKKPRVFASAVFDHGVAPTNGKYEYVVLVDSGMDGLRKYKEKMSPKNLGHKPYKVLQQDNVAHIVRWQTKNALFTGYTIFDANLFIGEFDHHFLRKVSRSCVIMVKETSNMVTMSVMDPDLRMFDKFIPSTKFIKEDLLYKTKSGKAWLHLTFNQNVRLMSKRNSYVDLKKSISKVYYQATEFGDVRPRMKMMLSHGTTTEVKLLKLRS